MEKNRMGLEELEKRSGYRFQNFKWLETAMRHSSYTNEQRMERSACNERLEFLGDAVLELISSEFLYERYPKLSEGELSKLRASLVCEPTLAMDAKALELGSFLLLGKGEEATGGRKRDSVVSDAMEAMIGAIYMDGGIEAAKHFVYRFILDDVEQKQLFYDSKTKLQEIIQSAYKEKLEYVLISAEGPAHARYFQTEVRLGTQVLGRGGGNSKKASEQQAAYRALCRLKETGDLCI